MRIRNDIRLGAILVLGDIWVINLGLIFAYWVRFRAGVFSLVKKDGISEKATEVFDILRKSGINVFLDHSGSIGKRYARSDEIGVPHCITIDYETRDGETVTVRERDTKKQERVKIADLLEYIDQT